MNYLKKKAAFSTLKSLRRRKLYHRCKMITMEIWEWDIVN